MSDSEMKTDSEEQMDQETNEATEVEETQATQVALDEAAPIGNQNEKEEENLVDPVPEKEPEEQKQEEVEPVVEPTPKRGRGRPPKAAKEAVEELDQEEGEGVEPTSKRGRGRPPKAAKEVVEELEQDEGEEVEPTPKRGRGRPSKTAAKATPKAETPRAEETPMTGRRAKRLAAQQIVATPTESAKKVKKTHGLSYEDFISWPAGRRVLSCGEGDQLGHPGRSTTKKPRKVELVEEEEMSIVQVVAGGVHSAILTSEGEVCSCGINEKGTVPAEGVEAEGSTDEYKRIVFSDEIRKEGKIVMITAGASFTAGLTNHGTVIAWGNLRDGSGKMDIHQQLVAMQQSPIIVLRHKPTLSIVKIDAGENHLVMLSDDGRAFTFGDPSMGQLGRSSRLDRIRTQYIAADSESSLHVNIMEKVGRKTKTAKIKNIFAGGFWSAFLTEEDNVYVCGLNNFGHLGIPIEEKDSNANDSSGDDTELRILLPQKSAELSGHNWTHIEGVQHLVLRDSNGDVYCIGKNTDNALGLGSWSNSEGEKNWRYQTLQKLAVEESAGVTAQLGCSIAWSNNGSAVAWGYDSVGQLGLGLKDDDDKIVATPQDISSAHLDGYKIVQVSVADNHALFLAVEN